MTHPSTKDSIRKVVLGDNLDVLATVPDESVDLVFMAGLDGLANRTASP